MQKRGIEAFDIVLVAANETKVDALYECCNAFYKENGDNATTVSCPKASLLRYIFLFPSSTTHLPV